MKQSDMDWGTGVLERAKTAKPYTPEEMSVLDDNKDLARLLATMAEYEKVWEAGGKERWQKRQQEWMEHQQKALDAEAAQKADENQKAD